MMKMSSDFTLSKYMQILLSSKFPQFNLLSAEEFIEFLKKRGIHRTISDLEYYDKMKIVKPVLRLKGSLKDSIFRRCHKNVGMLLLHEYVDNDLILLPDDNDFQPWDQWIDDDKNPLCMYYHPFQIVGFDHITRGLQIRLTPQILEKVTNANEYLSKVIVRYNEKIQGWQKSVKDAWLPRIGFLMLLEEAYAVHVREEYYSGKSFGNTFDKWQDWRYEEFSTKSIMKNSPLDKGGIIDLYHLLARINHDDPLGHWSPLLKILKRSRRRELESQALLSQDYYELAELVSRFIKEHFNEAMLEPDDLGNDGWKERVFGTPFDYNSKKTQKLILDHFLFLRPPRVAIVYEGSTEDKIIKKIIDALFIYLPTSGLLLCNAEGGDNIAKNFQGYFTMAKENEIDVFVIVDKDKKSIVDEHQRSGIIKENMNKVWENDFEYDNFGTDAVINKVNEILTEQNLAKIEKSEIDKKLQNPDVMLMNAIATEVSLGSRSSE